MRKKLTLILILLAFLKWSNFANAQCNIVSGSSGSIFDAALSNSVNYTVSVSGAASFLTFSTETACGLTFPGINAPWSGNTNSLGTVTYTFSEPINSVKVFLAYVGTNTQTNPESFVFNTNGGLPTLSVDPGTCVAWTINGNQITSPTILNAVNSIVTVLSETPFTTLDIISGTNSGINGGSSYGLCNSSLVTAINNSRENPYLITVYPNPNTGQFKIENKTSKKISFEVYNLLGDKVFKSENFEQNSSNELDLSGLPKGNYFGIIFDGERVYSKTIFIQ